MKTKLRFSGIAVFATILALSFTACGSGSGGSGSGGSSGNGGYSENGDDGSGGTPCLVTFNSNGGTPDPLSKEFVSGDKYGTLPVVTKDDYEFAGWNTEENGEGQTIGAEDDVISGDHTLYAQWNFDGIAIGNGGDSESEYKVTFYSQDGSDPNPPYKYVVNGDKYGKLPVVTKDGYIFAGWNTKDDGSGETIKANTVVSTSEDQFLYAQWRASTGGVYFVSTTTSDAGWGWNWPLGWDGGRFIDNTFDLLWPTIAESGPILLVIDNIAWADSWRTIMNNREITWEERKGRTLKSADIDPSRYRMIIIAEYMEDSSIHNMKKLVSALEEYVRNGGVLIDMIATNNMFRWSGAVAGPFGTRTMVAYDNENYVAAKDHFMVTGMTVPYFCGSSASHGRIKKIPKGSTVLLRAGTKPCGMPVACWLEF